MAKLNITIDKLNKVLDTSEHPSIQDLSDGLHTSASPQSIVGGVETLFTNNGTVRNFTSFPDHMTSIWNTSTNIASFHEEINTPIYVIRVEMTIDPSTTGTIDFKLYINDTSPKLIQTSTISHKNEIYRVSTIFTFYLGEESGYDVKNDGVYLTFTPSGAINVYDKTILIYRT